MANNLGIMSQNLICKSKTRSRKSGWGFVKQRNSNNGSWLSRIGDLIAPSVQMIWKVKRVSSSIKFSSCPWSEKTPGVQGRSRQNYFSNLINTRDGYQTEMDTTKMKNIGTNEVSPRSVMCFQSFFSLLLVNLGAWGFRGATWSARKLNQGD